LRPGACAVGWPRPPPGPAAHSAEVAPVTPVPVNGGRRRQRMPTPLRVGEEMGMR
jgi:hypothetical protein